MSLTPEREAEMRQRFKGWLPLAEWGPVCNGCGDEEYRIDGYCSIECRDLHSDEDVRDLLSEIDRLRAEVAALREALLAAWPGLIEDEEYQRRAYEVPIPEAWLLAKRALLGDVAGTREATSSGAGLPQGEYWLARGEQPERPPPDAEARAE